MAVKRLEDVTELKAEYERVKGWLKKALETQLAHGDEKDLLRGLGIGRFHLWTSENAACVTEFVSIDGTDVCLLYLVAGEANNALDEILGEGQHALEQWAKENGCKGFYGIGRPEWKRVLTPHGFSAVSVNYYKEFE